GRRLECFTRPIPVKRRGIHGISRLVNNGLTSNLITPLGPLTSLLRDCVHLRIPLEGQERRFHRSRRALPARRLRHRYSAKALYQLPCYGVSACRFASSTKESDDLQGASVFARTRSCKEWMLMLGSCQVAGVEEQSEHSWNRV